MLKFYSYLTVLFLTYFSLIITNFKGALFLQVGLLIVSHLIWLNAYNNQNTTLKTGQDIGVKIVLLFFIFFIPPFWENDFYRYMLDGLHLLNDIEPYYPSPVQSTLKDFYPELFKKIGFPEVPTVYPPLAISLFSFALSLPFGGEETFLIYTRILYFIFFFTGISFLIKKNIKENNKWKMLLIHPIVLIEGLTNAHFDLAISGICAFMLYSFDFMLLFLPIAVSIKYTLAISAVTFPLNKIKEHLLKRSVFFLLGSIISSIPFLFFNFDIKTMFKNLSFFASEWEMNSGAFRLFRWFAQFHSLEQSFTVNVASMVSAFVLIFIVALIYKFRNCFSLEKKLFIILGSLILLSPVCNPWYFLWLLPPAFLIKGKSGIWSKRFFIFTPLYYFNFLPDYLHDEIFITTLNFQHITYWFCLFMVCRSNEASETFS